MALAQLSLSWDAAVNGGHAAAAPALGTRAPSRAGALEQPANASARELWALQRSALANASSAAAASRRDASGQGTASPVRGGAAALLHALKHEELGLPRPDRTCRTRRVERGTNAVGVGRTSYGEHAAELSLPSSTTESQDAHLRNARSPVKLTDAGASP